METEDYSYSDDEEPSDYEYEIDIEEPVANDTEETKVQIFKSEELPNEIAQTVNQLNGILEIPPHICKALLNKYSWDHNRLIEKYYEAESPQEFFKKAKVDVPANASSNNFVVKKGEFCSLCCCDSEAVISVSCGHFFCKECWNSHLLSRFRNAGDPFASCPECNYYIEEEAILKLLKSSVEKEFYSRLVLTNFVATNPLLRWCPETDCNRVIKVKVSACASVTCECGMSCCFICGQEWHEPLTCQLLTRWIKKYRGDSETMKWVSVNTKDCPKCLCAIEKNGGCHHMTCRNKQCNYEFCWFCLQDWKVHGYNGGCSRYPQDAAAAAVDNVSAFREALQRYMHYFDRFMSHKNSLKAESKLMEEIKVKIGQMQSHYSWIESQVLQEAAQVLHKCRQSLMFAYAFAFYLPSSNAKAIFEDNQADLEHATEELSHLLEDELDLATADLAKLKQDVQDRSSYVDSRRQKMIQHCAEGIERGEWVFIEDN